MHCEYGTFHNARSWKWPRRTDVRCKNLDVLKIRNCTHGIIIELLIYNYADLLLRDGNIKRAGAHVVAGICHVKFQLC